MVGTHTHIYIYLLITFINRILFAVVRGARRVHLQEVNQFIAIILHWLHQKHVAYVLLMGGDGSGLAQQGQKYNLKIVTHCSYDVSLKSRGNIN